MSHLPKVTKFVVPGGGGFPERAVRGKFAEEKTRNELRTWSDNDAGFDFRRNYDAHTSGGKIPQQAGDFDYYYCHKDANDFAHVGHGVIEVKQVAHDFRLPRKNFDPAKWGILRRRKLAGGHVIVIVFHSTTRKWRCPPFGWFESLVDAKSWDLTTWPQYADVGAALKAAKMFS